MLPASRLHNPTVISYYGMQYEIAYNIQWERAEKNFLD